MTKQEIQALIDAKIAGQGSAVDVGGALPAILSEILNLATTGPEIPRAIQLSGRPEPSMTTVAALAEIGLTLSEIEAAARGERTGVVINGRSFLSIFEAYADDESWKLGFGYIMMSESGPESWNYWHIEADENTATVVFAEA